MNDFVGPPNPIICEVGISDNSSYLNYRSAFSFQEPLSGSTVGILMVLSTFQYQSPTMNPTYLNAIGQASRAAFVQSGGQRFQDQLTSKAENAARYIIHSIGITEGQLGVLLGATKVIRDRSVSLDGPRIQSVKTHFNINQTNGSIGLGWDFK